jgi:hypothetical protein
MKSLPEKDVSLFETRKEARAEAAKANNIQGAKP